LPWLCKVLGFLLGDGTMRIDPKSGKGLLSFYGKAPDLERLRTDLEAIDVTPSRIYARNREHTIQTPYAEYSFEHFETHVNVSSSALVALLTCLGAPLGNKAQQDYSAPAWLEAAPLWQKRLFLAALFGAELMAPTTMTGHGATFAAPVLSMNKREQYVASGLEFLRQLSAWLDQFGVETQSIASRAEQVNADGEQSIRLRLVLSNKTESLINLWSRVGYEYSHERASRAALAVQYLKYKWQVVAQREQAAQAAVALAEQGVPPREIFAQLVGPHVNKRFLERSLYGGRKTSPRIGKRFDPFDQFCAHSGVETRTEGMVWARIARIEPIIHDGDVYDLTVNHPDHNFIANGFVVSNCGVRLALSQVTVEEVQPLMKRLVDMLFNTVPTGVGKGGEVYLNDRDMDAVLERGSEWAVRQGYGHKADLEHTEERGSMNDADAGAVSPRAKKRGQGQLGTLGSGNHFIEVEVVDQIFDVEAAQALGLREGQIAVLIHSGSRGLGHQVCTDYVRDLQRAVQKYGIYIPDRELVCAPLDSPEGRAYFGAMAAAANYAWANRQCLLHLTRQAFEKALKGQVRDTRLTLLYDVAHNIGKIETHVVGGREMAVCVHRKGATRAFGPGRPELPREYRAVGQPVLIPGDMGSGSWVLVGTQQAMDDTFGSTCHGAGRVLSRAAAKRQARGEDVVTELRKKGIIVRGATMKGIAEEAPAAYKDVDRVVNVVHQAGIARKVARLRSLGVIKG
ncbi:MAG: RtcB family protein, partial [Chloroflexi bacterium]|nr:RtcB family protein [Chloroflexota bacterium]